MDHAHQALFASCLKRIAQKDGAVKPGPGAYEFMPALNPEGRYMWSKLRGSGSTAMRSFAPRFSVDSARVPGPGHYEHPVPVNAEGRNFVSRFRTSFSRTFGQAKRKFELNGKQSTRTLRQFTLGTPGPGSYQQPSEFGIYPKLAGDPEKRSTRNTFHSSPRATSLPHQ
jgi:hypothetical protein